MVKRIGKFIVLLPCILFYSLFAETAVKIHVTDVNGEALKQAAMGVPFVIEIIVESSENITNGTPILSGLQHLHIENQGLVSTISTSINGKYSNKKIFRYTVRSDKKGTFTIGPAAVVVNGKQIQSNSITIVVSESQQARDTNQTQLQLRVEPEKVMVGQPVTITMKFFPGPATQLMEMSKPELPGLTEPITGPTTGSENINNDEVPFLEWKTSWYPDKAGSFAIAPIRALYKTVKKSKYSRFVQDIFTMFDNGIEQKNIYSNNAVILVESLPAFEHNVKAVGNFVSLQASVDPFIARIGEGIVFKLSLVGSGNWNSIEAPVLLLPDGLKYYESKQYMNEQYKHDSMKNKLFEYIIQGNKEGKYTIASQTFYFYDTQSQQYKKMQTEPITITIKNDVSNQKQEIAAQPINESSKQSEFKILEYSWQEKKTHAFNKFIFYLLLLIPLIVIGVIHINNIFFRYRSLHAKEFQQKYALKHAKSELKNALKKNNQTELYSLFINFFNRKTNLHVLNETTILEYLKSNNLSESELAAWQKFFNQCAQAAFDMSYKNNNFLFSEAEQWLILFSKRLA